MIKKIVQGVVFLFLVAALIVPNTHCKKQGGTGQEGAAKPTAIIGDLQVVHASPQGLTAAAHESERLVTIFDHPMVPLQEIPDGEGSSFLKVEPSNPGKFRWMGTRTLTFTPSSRFPYATEVKVTIPAGTASLDGYNLKKDYSWTFKTISPSVVGHYPSEGQRWVKLDEKVRIVFNQPVDEGQAKSYLSLTETTPQDKQASIDFAVERLSAKELKDEKLEAKADNILVLRPKKRLVPDCSYAVQVRAGLAGKEGPLGLKETVDFGFETFKSFRFVGTDPQGSFSPYETLRVQFSNQVSYKDLASKVRFKPEVKVPDYYQEWDSTNDTIWLNLPFQPETQYTLAIPGDLQDEFGNKLGQGVTVRFSTTSLPPSIRMTTGQGVVESYGNTLYSFQAVNKEEVFFQGAELTRDQVVPLLTREKVFYGSENISTGTGFYGVEKKLRFKVPRNKRQLVPLNLREVLKRDHGLVFIQLDTQSEDKWDRYLKAMLQVTELGLTVKFSAENNVIWVTELRTGKPVPEADVEIRDDNNRVCWRGKTDKDGKVQSPGWKQLGIRSKESWEKPQQWVFASRQDDVAFMSSRWGTGVEPYRFGIPYSWEIDPETHNGYIFTERGIYRAGETVHVKGIVRKEERGQWRLPGGKALDCQVLDPFQKNVFKDTIILDAYGCFDFDLTTEPSAALGTYQITAKLPPEGGKSPQTFYSSFRVEAFRPAEFEVHLRSLKDSFVFGEDYHGEVGANYLFGGAMAGQKVKWHLRLNPAGFAPPAPKGFMFGNELDWDETTSGEGEGENEGDYEGRAQGRENSRLIGSGEAVLNAQGQLQVRAPLVPEKEKDSVLASLEATVQSPSRRSISNRIQTIVHRGEFYIGLKPDTSFLKKGDKLGVSVIASLPDGTLTERKVSLKLIKREWRSVHKAGAGGRFEWLTEREDTEVQAEKVATKKDPVTVTFAPEKSGFYLLLAQGTDSRKNQVSTSTYFYVTGEDYVSWQRSDDDKIELVPDSDSYRPGEKARILVKSPYERAKALVTVERESILESQVLELRGSTGQIEVPIVSSYIPNVFVSVLLVQGRTDGAKAGQTDDVGKPSFKIGYVKLSVNPEEKRLKVELTPDKDRYKPRDQVSVKLRVKDFKNNGRRASVALAVVDVGVLNLIGYTTPDPFVRFYGQVPLAVDTSDSRIHIVGQREFGEKGEDVGGGGEEAGSAGMSLTEVQLRGTFKTTPYWNPSVVTDEKGEATVSFALPDNLTTFRVMAVALTQDSLFGNKETSFRVAKPLQLQSALPRFARVGDVFQAGVVVHNFSPQKGTITLAGEFKGITPEDKDLKRSLALEPGASQEVLYAFKAEQPGLATFTFRAVMGAESDGLEITLPVQLPRQTETVALFGETSQSAEEKIVIPELYPAGSRIEVQASTTALSGLKECLAYLTDYPYLCVEQRLSAILPYILAPEVIQDFKLSRMTRKEWEEFVQKTIERIYEYQKDSGGFGLWTDSRYESPYLTCYAVFGLVQARQAGYDVDKTCLDRGVRYLKGFLREKDAQNKYPYSLKGLMTTRAFALYDLALVDQPEPAYVSQLFAARDNLTVFGKAMLLKAIHLGKGPADDKSALLQELANKVKVTVSQAHFEDEEGRAESWIFSSNLRTTAYVLQSMLEVGVDDPLLPEVARWIVQKQKSGHWLSTQENIYAFYALNTFYKTHEKVRPDFRAEMSLAGQLLLKEDFRGPTAETKTASTSLADFKPGQTVPLKISKKGEGLLYYGARMTYIARKPLDPRDEGLAVYKRISTIDGRPLEAVTGGQVVAVTLEIAVPQESLFVVVDDPLPSGFEAVNTSLLTESVEQAEALEESETEKSWWSEGFNHVEMHDDRVLLFADTLAPGVHTYRYLVRALNYGEYLMPGTKAEQMYSPEVFGRSRERLIKIIK